jgi:hypothetical protein
MTISELLREIGDDNVQFQVLNNDFSSARETPKGGQITFGTAPGNVSGMMNNQKRAFVVWMDEGQAQAAAARLRKGSA